MAKKETKTEETKKETTNNIHEVVVKIEGEDWTKALDVAFAKRQKTTKVDGFRAGKVPRDVYEKKFGKESLFIDAADASLQLAYIKAMEESKLIPVVQPEVDLRSLDETGVEFIFKITTKPEVKVKKYKGLNVKPETVEVTDEEVNHELGHLLERYTELAVKEGKVENKDIAVIDFEGFKDGVAVDGSTQIGAVIVVVVRKILAVKDLHGDHGLLAVALDGYLIGSGQIQRLCQFDGAGGCFLAQRGQTGNRHFLAVFVDLDLAQIRNGSLGSNFIIDGPLIRQRSHIKLFALGQGLAAVAALILSGITALQVDHRFLAFDRCKPVGLIVLGGAAPAGAAGFGAVTTDDEADLRHVLGNVDDDLAAVFALVEGVALAVLAGHPDPDVTVFVSAVIGPVEGHLVVAVGDGFKIFLHRRFRGSFRCRFRHRCFGGGLLRCLGTTGKNHG